MQFQVSDWIQKTLDNITVKENVQKAMQYIMDDSSYIIDRQCELALIPSPTRYETQKALKMLEWFKAEGLTDCYIDEIGNCIGYRRGTGGGRTVLVEGHMDTVFDLSTKLEIIIEDGFIKCPGIVDDNVGCSTLISVIRALNAADIQTKGDLVFVGTVREEGTGSMEGMKFLLEHHPEVEASVSVDGPGYQDIIGTVATGIYTYEIVFKGIAGHAWLEFGKLANPIHAVGRAITKIADFIPDDPYTTFEVTNLEAGSYSGVHAIPSEAIIRLNFRSNNQEILDHLRDRIFAAIDEACKEETMRWGKNTITYESKQICCVGAGRQDAHTPILEANALISNYLGCEEPLFREGGSTNCNIAMAKGIPSVCLGSGAGREYNSMPHSLAEQFKIEGSEKVRQETLLLTLMCAGMEDVESII